MRRQAMLATRIARKVIRTALRKISLDLVRYDHRFHPLARRMRLLSTHGITVVLDVGANVGQYAMELRALGYRGRIVSFEPLRDAFSELQRMARRDALWDVVNVGLGDTEETMTINRAANSYSSSFLKMLSAHLKSAPDSAYVGVQDAEMRTLDSVAPAYVRAEDRVFLKIDTQGYEYRVLKGASQLLPQLVGIQLEMSLVPLYEGELTFASVMGYVVDRGFTLMSLEPGFSNPLTGQLLQVDGLFFRSTTAMASQTGDSTA
jgi:FkbM family methyltransferase